MGIRSPIEVGNQRINFILGEMTNAIGGEPPSFGRRDAKITQYMTRARIIVGEESMKNLEYTGGRPTIEPGSAERMLGPKREYGCALRKGAGLLAAVDQSVDRPVDSKRIEGKELDQFGQIAGRRDDEAVQEVLGTAMAISIRDSRVLSYLERQLGLVIQVELLVHFSQRYEA